jgi:hypothetical protein
VCMPNFDTLRSLQLLEEMLPNTIKMFLHMGNANSKLLELACKIKFLKKTARTRTLAPLLNGRTYQAYAFPLSSSPWLLLRLAIDGFDF